MTPDVDALHPPLPRRVAERAVVLSAVLARAFIDQDVGNPQAERFRAELLAWLRDVGVEHEIEDGERALLTSQLGRVQPKVIVDATWQSEGLAVLAWALGRLALPAYDEPCDPKSAADAVGYPEHSRSSGAPRVRRAATSAGAREARPGHVRAPLATGGVPTP